MTQNQTALEQAHPDQQGLLPCPFCGDKFAHAELIDGAGEIWGVHCPNGMCPTSGLFVVREFSEAEAITAWNTRLTTEQRAPEQGLVGFIREVQDGLTWNSSQQQCLWRIEQLCKRALAALSKPPISDSQLKVRPELEGKSFEEVRQWERDNNASALPTISGGEGK